VSPLMNLGGSSMARILVVDDEYEVCTALKEFLE
jgi:hypothetical protein